MSSHPPELFLRAHTTPPDGFAFDGDRKLVPCVNPDFAAIDERLGFREPAAVEAVPVVSRDDLAHVALKTKAMVEACLSNILTTGDPSPEEIGRRYLMFCYFQNPITLKLLGEQMGVGESMACKMFQKFKSENEKLLMWFRSITTSSL